MRTPVDIVGDKAVADLMAEGWVIRRPSEGCGDCTDDGLGPCILTPTCRERATSASAGSDGAT